MTTTAIPTRPEELEEFLGDQAKVEALVGTPQFAELIQNYARTVQAKDAGITAQIKDETTRILAEMLDADRKDVAKLNLSPDVPAGGAKGAKYNRRAPGAALDGTFEDTGEFLQAMWSNNGSLTNATELRAKAADAMRIQNSFGSLVPDAGGFLIPEVMRAELLRVSLETAVVRPRARVIPMASARLPIPTIDSTSNASSVFGGVTAYWAEEGAAATESQASFGRVVLDAKKLIGYAEFPNELLADAFAVGSLFDQLFPEAISWFEDDGFTNGIGTGQPLGYLSAQNAAAVSVAKETGQPATTIVWENIVKMYSRMLPASLGKAVWVVHPDTFPQLATMALSVGTGGAPVWVNNGAGPVPTTILGRPVIVSEKAQTTGTAGDVNFVDFSYYLIGDRQMMTAAQSDQFKFSSDKTAFRITSRVDGRPWLGSPITPRNGSNTLSPFVTVAAR